MPDLHSPALDRPRRSEAQAERDRRRKDVMTRLGRLWAQEGILANEAHQHRSEAEHREHDENRRALSVALRVLAADRTWEA